MVSIKKARRRLNDLVREIPVVGEILTTDVDPVVRPVLYVASSAIALLISQNNAYAQQTGPDPSQMIYHVPGEDVCEFTKINMDGCGLKVVEVREKGKTKYFAEVCKESHENAGEIAVCFSDESARTVGLDPNNGSTDPEEKCSVEGEKCYTIMAPEPTKCKDNGKSILEQGTNYFKNLKVLYLEFNGEQLELKLGELEEKVETLEGDLNTCEKRYENLAETNGNNVNEVMRIDGERAHCEDKNDELEAKLEAKRFFVGVDYLHRFGGDGMDGVGVYGGINLDNIFAIMIGFNYMAGDGEGTIPTNRGVATDGPLDGRLERVTSGSTTTNNEAHGAEAGVRINVEDVVSVTPTIGLRSESTTTCVDQTTQQFVDGVYQENADDSPDPEQFNDTHLDVYGCLKFDSDFGGIINPVYVSGTVCVDDEGDVTGGVGIGGSF